MSTPRIARERPDPLLERLADLRAVTPRGASAERIWAAVAREWAVAPPAPPGPWSARILRALLPAARRLAPVAAVAAVLLLGSSQVLGATAESPLYGARVAIEDTLARLLPPDRRAAALSDLVRQRQGEVARLEAAASGATSAAAAARDEAEHALAEVVPPVPPRQAPPVPVAAPERVATASPRAPRPEETVFAGRVLGSSGEPLAGVCVTFGTARCAAVSGPNGRFTASVALPGGSEVPLLLYGSDGQLVGSLRFTANGAPVQLFGDVVAFPPAPPPRPSATAPPPAQASPAASPPAPTSRTTAFPSLPGAGASLLPPLPETRPAATAPALAPAPSGLPGAVTVTLSGMVRLPSGAPAGEACVLLGTQSDCGAVADADGAFRLRVSATVGSPVALYAYVRDGAAFRYGFAVLTLGGATEQQVGVIVLDR